GQFFRSKWGRFEITFLGRNATAAKSYVAHCHCQMNLRCH
ncbi:putative SET domain containing 3, partial [Danaus plexippus plexippus]